MKRTIILLLFIPLFIQINAQQDYWVFFKDKKGVKFDPYSYFDQKAIDRRIRTGVSLYDESDFPVNKEYVRQVSEKVMESDIELRWFNALAVVATNEQIDDVKKLPFVKSVQPMVTETFVTGEPEIDTTYSSYNAYVLYRQTDRMGRKHFEQQGIDGSGIRIAIFDGGFPNVHIHPAFRHIRKDNRIIKTWNFPKKREDVNWGVAHGTMVMSCIGGMINGEKIGLATGAEFLLAITEVKPEPYREEKWWMAAVEWADKNGADIINSSLGYGDHRYFREDMDGKTSLVSQAARMAARKGILVVNSAGNEGTKKNWQTIITPADVDSVLTIGGIFPDDDTHTGFSSYGPTADGKMKPNVSAYGHVLAAGKKGMSATQGTSFSSPLVAGFAACAWQTNRDMTNMDLFREIEHSGDLYPYFDYAHGYGVPQADYFTGRPDVMPEKTFTIHEEDEFIKIIVNDKDLDKGGFHQNILYYNIQNSEGILEKYYVVCVYRPEAVKIERIDLEEGWKINVHYKGYTESKSF